VDKQEEYWKGAKWGLAVAPPASEYRKCKEAKSINSKTEFSGEVTTIALPS